MAALMAAEARSCAVPTFRGRPASTSPRRAPTPIVRATQAWLARTVASITLLSTVDMFQRLGVFVGHGMERPTLEEQHLRTDEVYGSAVGEVGSK